MTCIEIVLPVKALEQHLAHISLGHDPPRPIVVIPIGSVAEDPALILTQRLRRAGFTTELGFSGNLGKRMKQANKISACAVVLLGENELSQNAVMVRDMESGEQEIVSMNALIEHLARFQYESFV